jgi:hypothetical protein
MPIHTTDLLLLLLEDLEDTGRTSELEPSDLDALRAVADWITSYVVKPNEQIGRAGTVCPFVPKSLERRSPGWLPSGSPTGTCRRSSS